MNCLVAFAVLVIYMLIVRIILYLDNLISQCMFIIHLLMVYVKIIVCYGLWVEEIMFIVLIIETILE